MHLCIIEANSLGFINQKRNNQFEHVCCIGAFMFIHLLQNWSHMSTHHYLTLYIGGDGIINEMQQQFQEIIGVRLAKPIFPVKFHLPWAREELN